MWRVQSGSTARHANASIPPSTGNAVELWVDPLNGSNSADGSSRSQALHTLAEAWRRIPAGVTLTTGYSILLVAGEYPESSIPTYWEDRHGTASAPDRPPGCRQPTQRTDSGIDQVCTTRSTCTWSIWWSKMTGMSFTASYAAIWGSTTSRWMGATVRRTDDQDQPIPAHHDRTE
jgi:hypothetical protein